jgi:hypothetical protein
MRKLFLFSFLLCVPFYFSFTQEQTTFFERAALVTGASVLFASVDYVGYNTCKTSPKTLAFYRVFQFALQGVLTWKLYQWGDVRCAIAFNVLWWTFTDDLLYYGIAAVVNPPGAWENRRSAGEALNAVTWAYWTPLGLARGGSRKVMEKPLLYSQSGAGILFSFTILF